MNIFMYLLMYIFNESFFTKALSKTSGDFIMENMDNVIDPIIRLFASLYD